MDKQLSEMTVTELKAVAYDQIQSVEIAQNNLRFINQEIQKRSEAISKDIVEELEQKQKE